MKHFLFNLAIVVFAIFIGSQITEGVILVPYWQSLSSADFYAYYNEFGPSIGQFYTVLTIVAALIPVLFLVYSKVSNNLKALKFALSSTFFALLFVSSFYIYFKGTNELFYEGAFSSDELKSELIIWSYWHWGRIVVEFVSLAFLIFGVNCIQKNEGE